MMRNGPPPPFRGPPPTDPRGPPPRPEWDRPPGMYTYVRLGSMSSL